MSTQFPGAGSSSSSSSGTAAAGRRGSLPRPGWQPGSGLGQREREQSVGAQSIASHAGTGASVSRNVSRRTGTKSYSRSGLGSSSISGTPGPRRKRDKHTRALLSIREFLKGRNCYDCLPVSFRLVVLDTKLVVKPAIEVMWQAGVVSAPLWQSTTAPGPVDAAGNRTDEGTEAADSTQATSSVDERSSHVMSPSVDSHDQQAGTAEQSGLLSPTAPGPSQSMSSLPSHVQPHSRQDSLTPSAVFSETTDPKKKAAATGSQQQRSVAPPPGQAGFAGMLTVNDIIHLIQYYYNNSSYDNASQDVERFRLESLRDIEHALNVPEPPLLSIGPLRPLFEACQLLIKTHARRLPLLDRDSQTGMDTVVSVLSQYRVLKFIAMNCRETTFLTRSIRSLGIGTYVTTVRKPSNDWPRLSLASSTLLSSRRSSSGAPAPPSAPAQAETPATDATDDSTSALDVSRVTSPSAGVYPETITEGKVAIGGRPYGMQGPVATATLDTTVFDVVHIFSELGVSAVPILDEDGYVVDLYETVDVIDLVRSSAYQSLDLTIRQALARRPKDFPGIMTCSPEDSLATIFSLLRSRRVHRLVILEPENVPDFQRVSSTLTAEQQAANAEATTEEMLLSGNMSAAATAAASAEHARQQQDQQKQTQHEQFAGQMRTRNRGKLVGILCLSDIMKYLIGSSPEHLLNPAASASQIRRGSTTHGPGASESAVASTTSSSIQDPHDAGMLSVGHRGGTSASSSAAVSTFGDSGDAPAPGSDGEEASQAVGGPASVALTAARFDPSDVPPTIQEQPAKETEQASNSTADSSEKSQDTVGEAKPAEEDQQSQSHQIDNVYIPADADQTPTQEDATHP